MRVGRYDENEVSDMQWSMVFKIILKKIVQYGCKNWPGMIVINAGQLHWTTNMEREMAAHGAKGVQIELDRELQQLDDIIALVRGGKLSKNQKTAIGALTVMDVHARDVVKNMVAQGVSNKNDFLWLSQLRFYWQEDDQLFWRPFGIHENMWIEMVASKDRTVMSI